MQALSVVVVLPLTTLNAYVVKTLDIIGITLSEARSVTVLAGTQHMP